MSTHEQKRVLFVDDEASIRLTLSRVLQQAGFEVRVAASVAEALVEINSRHFDILISDLNITDEGDGFLVLSAMRHLQPDCVNFILTGYPAFETALQAIHNQVDEYLVKPVDVEGLIGTITAKLGKPGTPPLRKTLASLLSDHRKEMGSAQAEADPTAPQSASPEAHPAYNFDYLLGMVIDHLQRELDCLTGDTARGLVEYGKARGRQGCTVAMLTRDVQRLRTLSYDVIQKHLAEMDMQLLIADLKKADNCYQLLMEKALEGLLAAQTTHA
jgi:ActR/RegA family two-component response regulator